MKRKLFIGSSKEGLDIANKLKDYIELSCGDWITCEVWNKGEVFSLNKSTLDCLIKASRHFDYGVLVATGDDYSLIRRKFRFAPRDNVLLELGMFIGSLGLSRAFILLEQKCKFPTDYNGITMPIFSKKDVKSIEKAFKMIIDEITKTKNSFNLRPIPSSALALGYFESFISPTINEALKRKIKLSLRINLPDDIRDITKEKNLYIQNFPSEEISIKGDGSRPLIYKYCDQNDTYWDIPTTLNTLNNLIDKMVHTTEIGIDSEKKNWVDYELRNFKGTIEILAQQCNACRGKVTVDWI